ncbi:MAG: hypothetical protein IT210_20400 [Armatimonadetes bacterium]|nr:hypothetical protein [Armatimonadota bacterium]
MSDILSRAGVRPIAHTRSHDVQLIRYRRGDIEILSLMPARETGKRTVQVEMFAAGYAYNIRTGKDLGRTSRLRAALEAEPALFALLPYRVTGLSLVAPATARAGQEIEYTVRLQAENGSPTGHVLRIEVSGPGGVRRYYASNQNMVGDTFTGTLSLAVNDAPGRWKIKATDVLTGKKVEIRVEVKGAL